MKTRINTKQANRPSKVGKALQEILAATPSFTDVKEGSSYVDGLRQKDRERDARHSLL
jgi:hypothetical protein